MTEGAGSIAGYRCENLTVIPELKCKGYKTMIPQESKPVGSFRIKGNRRKNRALPASNNYGCNNLSAVIAT